MTRHTENTAFIAMFVLVIIGAIACGIYIVSNNNTIKVIDGCQYIRQYNGHGWNLTHKGNCTNTIHYKK
jgi:multisubunit Na+/H+ antiporter MnhC subunit